MGLVLVVEGRANVVITSGRVFWPEMARLFVDRPAVRHCVIGMVPWGDEVATLV